MRILVIIAALAMAPLTAAQQRVAGSAPILDVHMHFLPVKMFAHIPLNCASPTVQFAPRDGREHFTAVDASSPCDKPVMSAATDEEWQTQMIKIMEDRDITGVVFSSAELLPSLLKWRARFKNPARVIPALEITPGQNDPRFVRAALESKQIAFIGEVIAQHAGISPNDPSMEPYYALAQEFDVPIGIHMGIGVPGEPYTFSPAYDVSLGNPLLLEPVLKRYPRVRMIVMHAGWPMLDEMVGLMYAHPQVYVDLAVLCWALPRKEFYSYLRRLNEAGFAHRILFGSDQVVWPQTIPIAIEAIEQADFLSAQEKRDILYNNAARLLRTQSASLK